MSNAIVRAEDRAFINGNGIANRWGLLLTAMVASWLYKGKLRQAATNDVANMMAAFPPEDIPDSIFLASSTILADSIKLQDASGRICFCAG